MSVAPENPGIEILVVDDDVVDRRQMERLLKAASLPLARSDYVGSLQACLDVLTRQSPDVVLLDLNLPDSGGLDTIARILQAHPGLAVIVVTGEGGDGIGLEALSRGAQDYLVKGEFDTRLLGKTIRYAVERRRQQDALRLTQFSVDSAADAVLWIRRDASILYVNEAATQLLGYSREELLRVTIGDLNPGHPPEAWESHWEDVRRHRSLTFEATLNTKRSVPIPVEITANYIEFAGQAYNCAFVRDITERRRMEDARKKSQWRHEELSRLRQSLLGRASLEEKLKQITEAIVRLFDADFCRVWLIKPGDRCQQGCIHADAQDGPHVCRDRERCLHLMTSSGRYTHIDGQGHRRVPFGCYKIGRVASGLEDRFLTNDAQNDPRLHNHAWAKDLGLVSFAGYQLRVPGGDMMGVLALFASHPISPEEDALLAGLGSTTAFIIQQATSEAMLRRSEAELQFRNAVLSAQQEVSVDGILVVDEKGQILSANQRFLDLWGVPPEMAASGVDEPVLKWVLDRVEEPQAFIEKVAYLYARPDLASRDEITLKDGRALDRYSGPMVGSDGTYYGRVWYFHEITHRKKVENTLREGEQRLKAVLDSLLTGVLIIDAQTHIILDVNPMAEKILGRARADLVGHPCHRYVCPTQEGRCPITDLNQTVMLDERMALRPDGTAIHILKSINPVEIRGQKCLVESFIDITDRKEAEEAIRRANEQLEKANCEMREMQAQIVQSEKLASIGQLAAGVAHEMNTPVGFVASNFQTLQKYVDKFLRLFRLYEQLGTAVEDGQRERRLAILEQIRQARKDLKIDFVLGDIQGLFDESREGLERVTSIIQNLRDFSRIDQAEELAEYNINEGLKAALAVAQNEIRDHAEVRLDLGDVPAIPCRANQINQVFLNMLVNAAQAIGSQQRQEKGTITLRTMQAVDHVICQISDDGPGIASEIISRIFDPFFTTKPVGKGTGLGLSISYDIVVNKHKGQILVESAAGQGTTFTIRLPIEQTKAAPAAGRSAGEPDYDESTGH
jgi:PAS domain S-box-containing protein